MTESELHELLADASSVVGADAGRAGRALMRGRRRRAQRRALAGAGSLAVLTVIGVAAVLFRTPSASPVLVAAVQCGSPGSQGAPIRVEATDTGLPLKVGNTTATIAQVAIDGQGGAVAPGVSELRLSVPPGRHQLTCTTGTGQRSITTLDVVDTNRVWASGSAVGCAAPMQYDMTSKFLLGSGEPASLTRQVLDVQSQDAVTTVGYRQSTQRLVAVVRNGRAVAVATWHQLFPGTWTLGVVESCSQSVRPLVEANPADVRGPRDTGSAQSA